MYRLEIPLRLCLVKASPDAGAESAVRPDRSMWLESSLGFLRVRVGVTPKYSLSLISSCVRGERGTTATSSFGCEDTVELFEVELVMAERNSSQGMIPNALCFC